MGKYHVVYADSALEYHAIQESVANANHCSVTSWKQIELLELYLGNVGIEAKELQFMKAYLKGLKDKLDKVQIEYR